MFAVISMGIFYSVYGVLGLLGVQVIPSEYRGKPWTKSYIRCRGISWVIVGIPWLVFYLIVRDMEINKLILVLILIGISFPSIIYSIAFERKYKALLKNEQESGLSES